MLILATWSQTFHSYFPLFDVDHLKIANCSNLTIVFYPLGNFGQALCIRSCHEDLILTRKSHNCSGIAFIQGDSAGGSKLIEQTISYWLFISLNLNVVFFALILLYIDFRHRLYGGRKAKLYHTKAGVKLTNIVGQTWRHSWSYNVVGGGQTVQLAVLNNVCWTMLKGYVKLICWTANQIYIVTIFSQFFIRKDSSVGSTLDS